MIWQTLSAVESNVTLGGQFTIIIDNRWFDELLQKVRVVESCFSIKVSGQWCKNDYDTLKMLPEDNIA